MFLITSFVSCSSIFPYSCDRPVRMTISANKHRSYWHRAGLNWWPIRHQWYVLCSIHRQQGENTSGWGLEIGQWLWTDEMSLNFQVCKQNGNLLNVYLTPSRWGFSYLVASWFLKHWFSTFRLLGQVLVLNFFEFFSLLLLDNIIFLINWYSSAWT